jgi:hypothetical protein
MMECLLTGQTLCSTRTSSFIYNLLEAIFLLFFAKVLHTPERSMNRIDNASVVKRCILGPLLLSCLELKLL